MTRWGERARQLELTAAELAAVLCSLELGRRKLTSASRAELAAAELELERALIAPELERARARVRRRRACLRRRARRE